MRNNVLLLVLLLFLYPAKVIGQNISGHVIDEHRQVLQHVGCLLFIATDSSYVAGTVSDAAGYFELPAEEGKEYLLCFSCLGYVDRSMIVDKMGDIGQIMLEDDPLILDRSIVTERRSLVKIENDRFVYNVSGIAEQRLLQNAYELIKELPTVTSTDGNSLSLVGAVSTTICVSGKATQMDANQLYDYLKALPADAVERIEVLYNAPPSWHVTGAVINIVLAKKTRRTFNGQIQMQWENQHRNSWALGGSLFSSAPKWNFDMMYNFADSKRISQSDSQGKHTLSDGSHYDISSAQTDYIDNNRHAIYTDFTYRLNEQNSMSLTYNGAVVPSSLTETISRNSLVGDARSLDKGHNGLHNVQIAYSLHEKLSAGVEYTTYSTTGLQHMFNIEDPSLPAEILLYWRKQRIEKIRAYIDGSLRSGRDWNISYGARYDHVKNKNWQESTDYQGSWGSYKKKSAIEESTATAYVGFRKSFWANKLFTNVHWSAELYKIDDYEKKALLPTCQITYSPNENNSLQISYQSVKRYPSYWQRQDYTSYADEYTMQKGNPSLRPSRLNVLNLLYILKNRYIFQVSNYRVDDFIIQQNYQLPDKLQQLYQPFNMEFTSSWQFNAIVPISAGQVYASNLVLTAYNERYKNNDWYGYAYDRDRWTGIATLNQNITIFQRPKLTANLQCFYRTPTIQGIWDLSSNWSVDAGLRCSCLKEQGTLSLQCGDLFSSMIPKIKTRFETQYMDVDGTAYHRSLILSFVYKFKDYTSRNRKSVDSSRFGI